MAAANGLASGGGFGEVIAALATMSSSAPRTQKKDAHGYLETFQKSTAAWEATGTILQAQESTVTPEVKLFAATTLKGKITYDIDQVPREQLSALRDSLLSLIIRYRAGPRPIRTQLCVCLANLTIQMVEWKKPLEMVVSTLGSDPASSTCVLEYLRVLPEEVTEGRKINLTDEQLEVRTKELLDENATQVQNLFTEYCQSSVNAARDPLLLDCITSWLREVGAAAIVRSPLLNVIINGLSSDETFDAAVECLCSIFKETKEVDEYLNVIQILYPHIVGLRPKIQQTAAEGDAETYKGLTRVFAEAGEAWVVLMARMPKEFLGLVEAILECCAKDLDREAVSLTFNFWYELKLYTVIEKYMEARMQFVPVYASLVDVMMKHLEFPVPETGNELDLFEGDRDQEDKFRSFRHSMGDVLKDCCEVIGVTECLGKTYSKINEWVQAYATQAADNNLPHWQQLEAPLFSMRSVGKMVDKDEKIILPMAMPLLIQIPYHEKVRFQSIMLLGRYTEWVAEHPEFLDDQLKYIIAAFDSDSPEVIRAAALALRFYCVDCSKLLAGHVSQLHQLYEKILDRLPASSQEEVTEGMAYVISVLPPDQVYLTFKLFCDPVLKRLMEKANAAQTEKDKLALADYLQLVSTFIECITPNVPSDQIHPAVKYCQEIFPILSTIMDNFISFSPICERVCRCWRKMIISYRTASAPLLPLLAEKLTTYFASSHQGSFLWVTAAIIREFSEGSDVEPETTLAIYQFFEHQATSMLRAMNDLPPKELPDVIEDFFRLLTDTLLFYPYRLIPSPLFTPLFSASLAVLTLEQTDPLIPALHYIRDVISYGKEHPPSSYHSTNPPEIQATILKLVRQQGPDLVQRILTGMMFSFPKDCFPDASGVLLTLVELVADEAVPWIAQTVAKLPPGTVSQTEAQRLLTVMTEQTRQAEFRKVRSLLQDFTNAYRRRNVAPRDGLGGLEPRRFRFAG
ncbi:MAG: Nuclear import receptor [Vezdaea aestivalis]|nr:MAG: Nuclear import receptor [Vezdaea aestivalis]